MPEQSSSKHERSFTERAIAVRDAAGADFKEPGGWISIDRILTAVRRHPLVLLSVLTLTTALALAVFQQPSLYRATAVLRLAGERRALSSGLEDAPAPDRYVTPLNSMVPRVLSRAIIGVAVDSLGLQLQPVPAFVLLRSLTHSVPRLQDVHVDPQARADTLTLLFSSVGVTVRHGSQVEHGTYGRMIQAGPAQFTVAMPPDRMEAVFAVLPRDIAINQVRQRLAVVPLPGTDALEVRYLDTDRIRAQQVANHVVQTFFSSAIKSSQAQARRRRLFLESQLEETERVLAQAQANLSSFRSRRRLASSSEKAARQQSEIMDLDSRSAELESDRRVFRSLLSQLETADDSARSNQVRTLAYSPEIAGDIIVGKVLQQLLTYRARLDSLTTGPWQSTTTNPDVVQLRQLVHSWEGELVRALRARLGSIEQRLTALGDRKSQSSNRIAELPVVEAEEAGLVQRVAGLGDFNTQLRLEYQKSRMSEALAAGDIEIVDLAPLPYHPVGVPWWVKVGLALVLGLVVATGMAVLLEVRNRSIREPEELEQVLHLRGLAVIPRFPKANLPNRTVLGMPRLTGGITKQLPDVAADQSSASVGIEAFRLLYSSLSLGRAERHRTVLVTSVGPQEGKTVIAANLAVTYAREGARVLLIDCDLKRPRLHKMFQVPRSPGLVEALRSESFANPLKVFSADEASVQHSSSTVPGDGLPVGAQAGTQMDLPDVPPSNGRSDAGVSASAVRQRVPGIQATGVKRLSLLPCGTLQVDSVETLKASLLRNLLQSVTEDYDVIILDTSPALVSADAVLLAQLVDDVLLVVRAGQTDREAAERAYQQLADAGAHVVGAVLNDPEGQVGRDRKLYYGYDYPVTAD